jgi:hypothetical protein
VAGCRKACLGNHLSQVDIASAMTLAETIMAVITAPQPFPWRKKSVCNENGISLGNSPRKN